MQDEEPYQFLERVPINQIDIKSLLETENYLVAQAHVMDRLISRMVQVEYSENEAAEHEVAQILKLVASFVEPHPTITHKVH